MNEDRTVSDDSPLLVITTLIGSLVDAMNMRHLRDVLYGPADDFTVSQPVAATRPHVVTHTERPVVQVTLPQQERDAHGPIASHVAPSNALFGASRQPVIR